MNTNEIVLICMSLAFLVFVGVFVGLWWLERECKRDQRRKQILRRFEEE